MFWILAAAAQSPVVLSGDAEVVYVASTTDAAPSKRFAADESNTGPTFDPAEALRVLIREKGMVRVRSGDDYGWLPAAAVVAENPKATTLTLPEGFEGLNIPGMN